MKPRITSAIWTALPEGKKYQRWHVEFDDSCGCREEDDFGSFATAMRFACHVVNGGSRWEFVA